MAGGIVKSIEEQWDEYTSKAVDKLSANFGDWRKLSDIEQEQAALWKMEADVYNGGFIQFICNWGLDGYQFLLRALKKIEANRTVQVIESQFVILDSVVRENESIINELWDIPRCLNEDQSEKLRLLDEELWNAPDDIARQGVSYYRYHLDTDKKAHNKAFKSES